MRAPRNTPGRRDEVASPSATTPGRPTSTSSRQQKQPGQASQTGAEEPMGSRKETESEQEVAAKWKKVGKVKAAYDAGVPSARRTEQE